MVDPGYQHLSLTTWNTQTKELVVDPVWAKQHLRWHYDHHVGGQIGQHLFNALTGRYAVFSLSFANLFD